jgi:hypothetical protein
MLAAAWPPIQLRRRPLIGYNGRREASPAEAVTQENPGLQLRQRRLRFISIFVPPLFART